MKFFATQIATSYTATSKCNDGRLSEGSCVLLDYERLVTLNQPEAPSGVEQLITELVC